MSKRKKRAIGGKHFIIISSIIALNSMGLSYAYWTDQLEIETTFTTGNINPVFCKDNYRINVVRDSQINDNKGSSEEENHGFDSKTDISVNTLENEKPKQDHGNQGGDGKEKKEPLSNLTVEIIDEGHTMYITGELEEGYKAFIDYCISNEGTIPVKYDQSEGKKNEPEDLKIQNGLKLKVTQESKVLKSQEKLFSEQGNGNPKVQIQVANGQDEQNKKEENDGKDKKSGEFADVRTFELKLPFDQWMKE